ncbi:MAG: tetratricopeptide repeat protein, partial [Pseudolabrys sp.]
MAASSFNLSRARGWLIVLSAAAALLGVTAAAAEPVRGEVKVYTDGGYARMVFRLAEEVGAKVQVSGAIMVITFDKPVGVSVDGLNAGARDYISAARRDPDGTAIRIALARSVKVNTIPAAERLYVDLLPDSWKGMLPGLPQEVVDELASRAREAERQLHKQQLTAKAKQSPLVRVRVARQPTFTRYMFDLPAGANAVPEREDGRFRLNFDQQIRWDLADAKASLPATLESVEGETDYDMSVVTFVFKGAPELRTFREDRSIVVDVGGENGLKPKAALEEAKPAAAPALTISAPETIPAKDAAQPPLTPQPQPQPQKEAALAPAAPAPAPAAKLVSAEPAPKASAAPTAPPAPQAAAPAPVAPEKAAAAAPKPLVDPNAPVPLAVSQSGDDVRLEFPFAEPVAAAMFRRADVLWLVFDSPAEIDLKALTREPVPGIRSASFERAADGAGIVRIKLNRPRLTGVNADGPSWVVNIADSVTEPTRPLMIVRSVFGKNQAGIAIPFDDAAKVHRLRDSDIGDRLIVVTAPAPARGFLKSQAFVELQTLASAHGVAIHPIADDLAATIEKGKVMVGRPGGLSLSSTSSDSSAATPGFRALTFDTQLWGFDRQAPFVARQSELIRLAAAAPEAKRKPARFNLARFYLARDMAAEAKAVLDVAIADQRGDDVTGSLLRAVAEVMLDRPDRALKELSGPQIGNQPDAPIWRAIAFSRQGKWEDARKSFKGTETAIAGLPIELQRLAIQESLRSAIEVRDFSSAARLINELEMVGSTPELEPTVQVLTGRLYEGLGRTEDALANYRAAAGAKDRRAAAQGRLREIDLMFGQGSMPRKEAINALETLTAVWRGDETETEGLKLLAHLYTEESRYRDAFHVMRTALLAHPNSDMTRKIQDEAARTFDSLFLAGKGDALPPIEALGLFYDFRELTPIGRRGDEMIRRLADRLVSVDLLDQAAELMQHQVDHRLQGAARAQVATRLAVIYLMNRKPARALATLQKTRASDLAHELRDQRLLLEARSLSDTGRHELALEVGANIAGKEAIRLRSDILWAAARWREASEQIELLYGERWRDFKPLSESERTDIMRAALGYAMADEQIGLMRLSEKYAAKMAEGPDRKTFEAVSGPIGTNSAEFQNVAKRLANTDTLAIFLRELKARYPDASAMPAAPAPDSAPVPAAPPAPKPAG